jgi:exosortase K
MMTRKSTYTRVAQLVVVLLGALTLKLYYSTASANQLRWILAPTTFLIELISGTPFEFESNAGYLSSDRSFLIAASCAGVNFLITSFLMLSLRKLWRDRSRNIPWKFIPAAALLSYFATLITNTVRISTAFRLRRIPLEISGLSGNQLHRFEGIFIYFGFLLLLFMVSEKINYRTESGSDRVLSLASENPFRLFRQCFFPLAIYYGTTLGIPLANGLCRGGIAATDFWEHSIFVLLTPLLLILPLATFRLCINLWKKRSLENLQVRKADPCPRSRLQAIQGKSHNSSLGKFGQNKLDQSAAPMSQVCYCPITCLLSYTNEESRWFSKLTGCQQPEGQRPSGYRPARIERFDEMIARDLNTPPPPPFPAQSYSWQIHVSAYVPHEWGIAHGPFAILQRRPQTGNNYHRSARR